LRRTGSGNNLEPAGFFSGQIDGVKVNTSLPEFISHLRWGRDKL
jgi:hypothetical protein